MPLPSSRPAHLRRRARPLRRWPRRVLVTVNVLIAVCLVSAGLAYGYARYRIDAIHTVAAANLTPQASDEPENILLIGNETRSELTNPTQIREFGSPQEYSGSLSDVIMVLHLDPTDRRASILSIPRDLLVPMPAGSPVGPYEKIDAALNDGAKGPDNLIAAIHEDLGIPINHYVELNFDGFEKTVDALGGIRMDFPERLYDQYSLLDIRHTGCQLIHGAQALALVRSRHLQYDPPGVSPYDISAWPYDPESDLARIVRDHTFLRVLITTGEHEGLTNPIKGNAFLGALTDQITMDPGLAHQLIRVAVAYRGLSASDLPETTIPVTTVADYSYGGYSLGDVDFPDQPADDEVIAKWDAGALPASEAPTAVQVDNAAGTADLAADTGAALRRDGMDVTAEGDAPIKSSQVTETLVRYHPAQVAEGLAVAREFSGAIMLDPDAAVPAGTVRVDVGTTEAVAGAAASRRRSRSPVRTRPAALPAAPTPAGQRPSSANDQLTPYDPRAC